MEQVLIVDPDPVHAAELQRTLESEGYRTTVCADERNALELLQKDRSDLVIMVPRSPVTFGDMLASAGAAVRHLQRRPELLFVLRWTPRGPAERLMGDRSNVQVLYER
jgi:CheY-like chemotaxis protein